MLEDIRQLIKEVLEKGYLMSLATMDSAGLWVSDVIYVHDDDLNIYWMSGLDVRHSKAIHSGSPVAGTITISGQGEDNLGIQFEGIAEKIDGPRYDLTVKHFTKRKKTVPDSEVDVLQGKSWYVVKPKKIDLIHEPLYGFKKQKLEL